jgi:hypothetical protein
MARGKLAPSRVNRLGRRERAVLYRAAAVTRGGGEGGWEERGSSSCFNCAPDRITVLGTGTDADAGNTKAMGTTRGRSLGWQQDMEHAVSPPML